MTKTKTIAPVSEPSSEFGVIIEMLENALCIPPPLSISRLAKLKGQIYTVKVWTVEQPFGGLGIGMNINPLKTEKPSAKP